MKQLTEAQAWTVIAARYDGVDDGWESARLLDGICRQVSRLAVRDLISSRVYFRMKNRMNHAAPPHFDRAYWWKRDKDGAEQRELFCRRMAMAAER